MHLPTEVRQLATTQSSGRRLIAPALHRLLNGLSSARTDGRIGIAAGNSSVKEIAPLANPANEAGNSAQRLSASGFERYGSKLHLYLKNRQLQRCFNGVSNAARDTPTAFCYVAGQSSRFNSGPHQRPVA